MSRLIDQIKCHFENGMSLQEVIKWLLDYFKMDVNDSRIIFERLGDLKRFRLISYGNPEPRNFSNVYPLIVALANSGYSFRYVANVFFEKSGNLCYDSAEKHLKTLVLFGDIKFKRELMTSEERALRIYNKAGIQIPEQKEPLPPKISQAEKRFKKGISVKHTDFPTKVLTGNFG